MLNNALNALRASLSVPVIPAPHRAVEKCAVYRYIPGKADGATVTARLELTLYDKSYACSLELLKAATDALVVGGALEFSPGITAYRSGTAADSGYLSGTGLYFIRTLFVLTCGAADTEAS